MDNELKELLLNVLGTTNVCVIDTEYNNIISNNATKMWCASCEDLSTGETTNFHPKGEGDDQYHDQFKDELKEYLEQFDYFVAHHLWGAEYPVLKNLIGFEIKEEQAIDSLVWSRTLRPSAPFMNKFRDLKVRGWDTRLGGHGIAPWGKRLGLSKIEFDDYVQYTHEMMDYCERDKDVNVAVFKVLLHEKFTMDFSDDALELENKAHKMLVEQQTVGFTLDKARAKKLIHDSGELIQEYTNELHKVFPPVKVIKRTITPRTTFKVLRDKKNKIIKDADGKNKFSEQMHGTDRKSLLNNLHEEVMDEEGKPTGTYNIYEMETFNPSSPQQVGRRLLSLGWNPKKYTATGLPSTSKDNLGEAIDMLSLEVPEVEVLRKYNIVTHRNQTSKEWLILAEETGRVHGRINHIGPWTHRSSHMQPNMGNIAKVQHGPDGPLEGLEGNFGWDSRHCWVSQKGWSLVGCDASGIQLRALAHYMQDEDYIREVCEGDVHITNMKAAGIERGYQGMSPRDVSKRFIYAWLLGAGDEKIGQIVGVAEDEYEALFENAKKQYKWNFFRHDKNKREKAHKFDNLLFWATDKLRSEGRIADKKTTAVILKGFYTKKKFLDNLPALRRFKERDIEQAAARDYMLGLDGRRIWVPNAHFAMGAYLQGFEAVVMKKAMSLYQEKLKAKKIPFHQVAYVHDEFQIETPKEHAEFVGETVVWAIKEAGIRLRVICPLDGEYKVGTSWAETH